MPNGSPPPGWGEPEPLPMVRDSGGHRLAADVLCRRILDGVQAQYRLAGFALPSRAFVAPGAPSLVSWDCEQLSVAATGIAWGPAAAQGTEAALQIGTQTSVGAMRHLVLEIAVVRKLPAGASIEDDTASAVTLPDLDALHDAGVRHMQDLGLLSQALVEMFGPDPVKTIVPAGTHSQPGLVRSEGPEGGYVGAVADLAVTLGETA